MRCECIFNVWLSISLLVIVRKLSFGRRMSHRPTSNTSFALLVLPFVSQEIRSCQISQ